MKLKPYPGTLTLFSYKKEKTVR